MQQKEGNHSNFSEGKININVNNKSQTAKIRAKSNRFLKLINWATIIPMYLVVILLPLFFLNNTPSPMEFNKQILLVSLIGTSVLIWIGKMAWKNEMKFRKSFLLIPILTFLLIYGLSTVFSGYYEQSMWGYFGGESRAFVSVLFLITFFILVYNNVKNYEGIIKFIFSFMIGGLVLVLFGIFQFFEIYLLPFEFAKSQFFNPIGSIYVYAIFIAAFFLLNVTLFLSRVSKGLKLIFLVLSFLSFFMLMAINFKMIWVVLLIMLAVILGMTILIENKQTSQSRIIPMIFLVFVLFFVLKSKPLLDNSTLPVEIFIKHKTAAEISLSSLKENPLLGSGPALFGNVYKQHRPSDLGDFSVVNFNESTSYFFTLASTMGILGVLSFLFVIFSGGAVFFKEMTGVIKNAEKRTNLHSYLSLSIGIVWIFLTIFLFLYFVNLSVLMLWWLFFALLVSVSFLNRSDEEKKASELVTTSSSPKTSFFLSFGFVLVIICFIAVLYLQSQKYLASIYFSQAVQANNLEGNIEKTAEKMSKAVSLDPNRDTFYRDLAVVHLTLAKKKIAEKGLDNLTPEENNYISTRFRSALEALNQAKNLNPADSLNFVSVAELYKEFIVIQKDAGDKAIENYQKAIELDPKNPNIYQAMANVQVTLSDMEMINSMKERPAGGAASVPKESLEYLAMAEDYLRKALEIKADHIGSNVLLVAVYEKMGNIDKAIEKAQQNLEIYPNSSELAMDLGRLYYQKENIEEAEKSLRRSISLNDQYANARYLLGLVLDKKGDKEGALVQFEKIKETNPDNETLIAIINNLKNGRTALSGLQENQVQESIQEIPAPQEDPELETSTEQNAEEDLEVENNERETQPEE